LELDGHPLALEFIGDFALSCAVPDLTFYNMMNEKNILLLGRGIKRISFQNCLWSDIVLLQTLHHFFAYGEDLEFEISNANMVKPDMWSRFFSQLHDLDGINIVGIEWNGNWVSEEFFVLLQKCPRLKTLKLKNIKGELNPLPNTIKICHI
jgi:hypothetical protein